MENNKVQAFRNAFQEKHEPLIFYGTGKIASLLLPEITDYNIVGLLDREREQGMFLDIPILNINKLCDFQIKKIIILAAERNIPVIYRRIAKFCKSNGIIVYDLCGRNLAEIYDIYKTDIPYFHKSWKDLYEAIDGHDIISFDIFDTLLIRKVLYPHTIFDIIEKKLQKVELKIPSFSKLRLEVSSNLDKKNPAPNIYEIYDEIQQIIHISDKEKRFLIDLEIDVEKSFIAPRDSMLKLFNEIKEYKSIYLVSNMYFTEDILEDILHACGYIGYKEILISCEYRKSKQDGLFNSLVNKVKVSANHILHIGDSSILDKIEPQKVGIEVFPIMSMIDMLANSSYSIAVDYDKGILNKIILGHFLKYAFDDPFILYETKGRLKVSKIDVYVKMFLSPLALFYSLWILKETEKLKIDYIMFTSRDAYLLEHITNIFLENQKLKISTPYSYFYASRRAVSSAAVFNEDDAKELANRPFYGSIKDMFFIRFGICIEENSSDIEDYIKIYKNEILNKCAQKRRNYQIYIHKNIVNQPKRIAVVDQCGYGNVQKGLAKIMTDKKLHGFFLRKSPGVVSPCDSSSFFPVEEEYGTTNGLGIAYLVLEQFLSSPEPSLVSFDENGNPLFEKEIRSIDQLDNLKNMHLCTLNYCEEIINLFPEIYDEHPDWKLINLFLEFLDEKYTEIHIPEFLNMKIEDNFGQGRIIDLNKN